MKDCLDTAGVPTQCGSKIFAGIVPDADATAVARMKAAGGILLAKTNLPEFSSSTETDNLVTGRTNNPWNLDRTPGGSSGGDSAAIAAGMSPLGIGSDVAISVRGPAAFTGIAGLKATHGRIPFTGHFAPMTSAWWHVGPMARTVGDVALTYSVLSGPDGVDGYAVHPKHFDADATRIPGQALRVGWVSDEAFGPVDPEITAAVERAAARLAELGCHVEQVGVPFLKQFGCAAGVDDARLRGISPLHQDFGRRPRRRPLRRGLRNLGSARPHTGPIPFRQKGDGVAAISVQRLLQRL